MNYDDIPVTSYSIGWGGGGGCVLSHNQMYMKSMTVGHGDILSVGGRFTPIDASHISEII